MLKDDAKTIRGTLLEVRGFLQGFLRPHERIPAEAVEMVNQVDAAIGLLTEANYMHDAGAYARCSFCLRYSASPASILHPEREPCDCGQAGGWSGSFQRPGKDAKWSTGLESVREGRVELSAVDGTSGEGR